MPVPTAVTHRANFIVLQHLVQAGFLHVDELAANQQQITGTFQSAPLLGGAVWRSHLRRYTLPYWQDARVGMIGEFCPANRRRSERILMDCFTGARAHGFAAHAALSPFSMMRFATHWIRIEMRHQPVIRDRTDNAFHLGGKELFLGLIVELWIRVLDGDDRDESLQQIITGNRWVPFPLSNSFCLAWLIHRALSEPNEKPP